MFYAVIMAGGSGTRLWPLSRQGYPKQALKLVGERTMFQYAVDRITPIIPLERIFVVTGAEHALILQAQVPDLPMKNFILEPEGRGTAPAIGLAAVHLEHVDPNATMAVLTADHFITNTERFRKVLTAAEKIAAEGNLVTLGIQPSSPSTGFGYIHQGSLLGKQGEFNYFAVQNFTEKPDSPHALKMVESGEYSWNSGMFIWQTKQILDEFKHQMPDFYSQLMSVKKSLEAPDANTVLKKIWPQVAKQSIDYGVMEGAKQVVVIPIEIGWTDIGSWGSLFELLSGDANQNVVIGKNLGIDTEGTLVFGGDRIVATLGVKDLLIIDTDDVLMVCSREREQDVKVLVEQLRQEKNDRLI